MNTGDANKIPRAPEMERNLGDRLAGCNSEYRPTMAEVAAKAAIHHTEEATRHQMAAAFFHANPQFEEFIQLVRSGAIRI